MKKSVLFLCTGNSCRSQMAEGILKHLRGDDCEAHSAGTHPASVNPNAVRVMNEIGIDISHHTSKSVNVFLDEHFDVIITVCDNAKESCPVFNQAARKIHWGIEDPACATGSEEEVLSVFRKIRDDIKRKIKDEFCK